MMRTVDNKIKLTIFTNGSRRRAVVNRASFKDLSLEGTYFAGNHVYIYIYIYIYIMQVL